jgi:hypothetical protein
MQGRCYSFLLFKHRQEIAGRVFKPRDLRTPAAENPLFVCHQVAFMVGCVAGGTEQKFQGIFLT